MHSEFKEGYEYCLMEYFQDPVVVNNIILSYYSINQLR